MFRSQSPPKLQDVVDERRCITNISQYAKYRFQLGGPAGVEEGLIEGDLDGDGESDYYAKIHTAPKMIFASNRGCVRDLGTLKGRILGLTDDSYEGFRSIMTFVSTGCGGYSGGIFEWRVQEAQLKATPVVACGCPDLARPDPTRNRACPAVLPQ